MKGYKIHNKPRKNGSKRCAIEFTEPSLTEQNHKEECNINKIMQKVERGHMVPVRRGSPLYGDFTGYGDFQECQDRVIAANDQFMQLPAEIRNKFDNDPGKLIEFMADPNNEQEARELGLLEKEKDPIPPTHEPEKVPDKGTEGPQEEGNGE